MQRIDRRRGGRAEDARGYAGICGALPRTPVKTLLGKGLDNPQNLSRGSKIGIFSANGRLRKRKSLCGESVLDFVCVIDKERATTGRPPFQDSIARKYGANLHMTKTPEMPSFGVSGVYLFLESVRISRPASGRARFTARVRESAAVIQNRPCRRDLPPIPV